MGNNRFIERSLVGVVHFLKESLYAEESARAAGFMQSLDPRFKILACCCILLAASLAKSGVVLAFLYALCLLAASVSRINLLFFLKRTWVFIPLFSLVIAIPAAFSVFSPGDTVAGFSLFGVSFTVTRQGLHAALLFVTRVVTSLSFVVLVSLTTRHAVMLKVLRIFKVPQVFVMTMGMCYRYIYVFLEIIENTYRALKSRVGTALTVKQGRQIVAWHIGTLWQRSYEMNTAVYRAMLSRGYAGEPQLLEEFNARRRDYVVLACAAGIFVVTAVISLGG